MRIWLQWLNYICARWNWKTIGQLQGASVCITREIMNASQESKFSAKNDIATKFTRNVNWSNYTITADENANLLLVACSSAL